MKKPQNLVMFAFGVLGLVHVLIYWDGLAAWYRVCAMPFKEVKDTAYMPLWTSMRGAFGVLLLVLALFWFLLQLRVGRGCGTEPGAAPNGGPVRVSMNRTSKLLLGLTLVPALCVGALIALRVCGLIRPFSVPTGAMMPAVSAGDHVVMEGFTFLLRQPRRGDIVVFKTDGISQALVPSGEFWMKRVAGEPGEHMRISGGKLFINDKEVTLRNKAGEITFDLPANTTAFAPHTDDLTVPSGCYFVLGDNSTNSLDSRFWGCVPRRNIIGRISLCYWPPQRVAGVK